MLLSTTSVKHSMNRVVHGMLDIICDIALDIKIAAQICFKLPVAQPILSVFSAERAK